MSAPSRTYGGRYEILERVGSGGMADVYRARDELLGREVAIKLLSERYARDRSFVERFRREAQSAASLNHPNIVSLYDYGSEDDRTYFIVMEYIDGRSLAEVLRDEGALMPERAAEIASDVATALDKAHTNGTVHRDIKPGNIMLTSTGQTKVTDFGIARALGGEGDQTMTQTGMVIGTAAYLSPEQAQGNPVDARSDVYSLGVVLYEMLTGQTPFSGDSPLSIAYKHVRETAQPPSALNRDVSPELDAIVMKALAKNPANRYPSAGQMREDLQRFLSGQKVQATPLMAPTTVAATPSATRTQVISREELDEAAPEPEPGRRAGWYLLTALGILALFGVLAWLLFTNLIGDEAPAAATVEVPDVVGMRLEPARDRLEEAGLDSEVERRFSGKPRGEVIDQDPAGGEEVEEGSVVTLSVSRGPRQVSVPDLTGMTVDEATDELEENKLELGEVTPVADETVPEGQIVSQDPAAGERVKPGARVDVSVSSGAPTVVVPDVLNQSEDSAVAEIERAGLVAEVTRAPNDEVEEGLVFAQDPSPGSEADEGDVVRITVSEGPEARPMPDVRGQDADEAEATLENEYGLVVTIQERICEAAVPPGTVCEQDPAPRTPVEPGDSATLIVQEGEASRPTDRALALSPQLLA